ncbi:MAG: DUF839 domain-containing protein [Verrucomicrobia bacterium]|nr:DUF839 domain-containing protein [Verrucomicrobiota bacterium]
MNLSRRSFINQASAIGLGFLGLRSVIENGLAQGAASSFAEVGYGPLLPDPDKILDLPSGFTYRMISLVGERMDDGLYVPGKHDGMAAFPGPNGETILVRNHELEPAQVEFSPFGLQNLLFRQVDQRKLYDPGKGTKPALGGTTTIVYDTRTGDVLKHFLSLAGTHRNCAGGPTPWNSWITCEETVEVTGGDIEKDHGYNFEVPASTEIHLADPLPLIAMGRFRHEAVAVDPQTGIVYETEDRPDGLIYRFLPNQPGRLQAGGRLQALRVRNAPGLDTRNWRRQTFRVGGVRKVDWVDLDDITSPDDDLRYQGRFEKGAARFARGEGMWYGHRSIYFACTNGGEKQKGQIWRYVPSRFEGTSREKNRPGTLELFIEPNDANLVENADNLTVAPWGDLIVCEDGTETQLILGVTPQGRIYKIGGTNISELAGATFSPDGTTLFVNIQTPGWTLAIKGPWRQQRG